MTALMLSDARPHRKVGQWITHANLSRKGVCLTPASPVVPEPRRRLKEPLDGAGWMQGVGAVVLAAAFHGAGNLRERPGFGVDAGRVREGTGIILLELAAVDG